MEKVWLLISWLKEASWSRDTLFSLWFRNLKKLCIQYAYQTEYGTVELQWLEPWWLIHLGWLELLLWSLQVILGMVHPGWLELPLARTIFHGPKPVRAIEVLLLYSYTGLQLRVRSENLIFLFLN